MEEDIEMEESYVHNFSSENESQEEDENMIIRMV